MEIALDMRDESADDDVYAALGDLMKRMILALEMNEMQLIGF